jgi:hypothetical protein
MILSSNPSNRDWRFLTNCGSNSPLRSRGTSIGISPCFPLSVLRDLPLWELPEFLPSGECFS